MTISLHTSKQRTITLGEELGKGGEGIVYAIAGQADQVAKLYHAPNRTVEKEQKLEAMIANPPLDESRSFSPPHISIAWPSELLYIGNQFAGFSMPRITQSPDIFKYYNPTARMSEFSSFDWRYLHRTAQNLAIALHALHMRGYVMGDVNQKNILVTPSALVTLVDTDSFQVADNNGIIYRCPVGVPEYTAPELQGLRFDQIDRTPLHDNFGLAILIFQLLMEGYHPFTGSPVDPTISVKGEIYLHCIKQGIFPYQNNLSFAPPLNAPSFDALHPTLQALFLRCFVNGHFVPNARPSAIEWFQALSSTEKTLVQCANNPAHWYANSTNGCHWCKRELRNGVATSSMITSQQPLPTVSRQSSLNQNSKASSTTTPAPSASPTLSKVASQLPTNSPLALSQNRNFFYMLMNGDFGLAGTYWGMGVGMNTLLSYLANYLEPRIPSGLFSLLGIAALVYDFMLVIGIWRASNKYRGPRIWSILAKIMVVLYAIILIGVFIDALSS